MSKNRFSFLPDIGANMTVVGNVQTLSFGDSYEQRATSSIHPIYRKQSCTFTRPINESNEIYAFLTEYGYVKGFEQTDPRGEKGVWVVEPESLSMKQVKPGMIQITVTFVEKFEV